MIRQRLEAALQRLWFEPAPAAAARAAGLLLAPLSRLVATVAARQRRAIEALPAPPVPVVVVGNLVVGGAGKTPLVAATVAALAARGWTPGIVARGHGARRTEARLVRAGDDAADAGDEPLLLAAQTGRPVAAGRRRAEALALLLQAHPEIDVVVSDDGLQHAGLPRSIEIAVFDARGAGNGRLLPAGPLREPLAHLAGMDAIALNGPADPPAAAPPAFRFDVVPERFVRVDGRGAPLEPAAFRAAVAAACGASDAPGCLAAVAGIGAPARFFQALEALGLPPGLRVEPGDHQVPGRDALRALRARFVVMTTKDAVKCRAWADDRCWALEASARLDPAFVDWLDNALREANLGRTPARHPGVPDLQGPAAIRTRRHGA
ncbi:tetraacyldisaccharide 4'-kinase [Burkholderiaceae bacterium FT117]|uniref:tetraacyldisaccharide 4'-kinase n=1 Tax=Zeimonas sediminis TaxID=2944268 RepID=UPI00234313FB|nr:tetraacyldisaccharide 4'-kinase [Zeimonas sediminis]MCM5572278.1 tetraacyldisaccharide 4'-kinase [Zeimonas sediminis]